jgi:hypothetical protein
MTDLNTTLQAAVEAGALILIAPGAEAALQGGTTSPPRRAVPAGAVVPLAEGARLADPGHPVLAVGSEDDIYTQALGDLLHAAGRNTGITCLVVADDLEPGIDGLALVQTAGGAFVARTPPGGDLTGIITDAAVHDGFALIQVGPADAEPLLTRRPGARQSFESLVIGQSELFTTISTTEWDDWERIIYGDGGGGDDDDGDSARDEMA